MVDEKRNRAIATLQALKEQLAATDPDQDVMGNAVPVLDSVLQDARQFVDPDDPVHRQIAELFSAETIVAGSVRAYDANIVVTTLLGRIGPPEIEAW